MNATFEFDWPVVASFILQQRKSNRKGKGKGKRRGIVVVAGHHGAGKSSLLWRLQNPDKEFKSLESTNGIAVGELDQPVVWALPPRLSVSRPHCIAAYRQAGAGCANTATD